MILQKLYKKKLIHPPKFLLSNTHYLTLTGSVAYGCASDTSDNDVCGFCIPNLDQIFPHLAGEITDFGTHKTRFNNWQKHGIVDKEENKEWDFSIYSIVNFFNLCMDNNPNMIDVLFVPQNCIIHSTAIGNMVRENRHMFLHKGCWSKMRGYSYSQMHKMAIKNPEPGSYRAEYVKKYGYDLKFGYHVVRLLLECQQILTLHDLDLQRDREVLKSIRRGEWTEQDIRNFFEQKEKELEKIYTESTLPWGPDEPKIKQLLLDCLEHHFGSLDKAIVIEDKSIQALREIQEITQKVLGE